MPGMHIRCTCVDIWTLSQDALDALVDIREHDVPYHVRFAIDCDVRCGHWFSVRAKVG
jgi:DNA polymerase epsilon subunit 1